MTIKLEVKKRDGKAAAGEIPAVVYGPKQEPISLTLDQKVFDKVLKEAGESTIVSLEGAGEAMDVLIHEISFNPVKGFVEHVDFYAIEKGKKITVDVPLEFIGEAPALKLGGVLTKALYEIEVTCAPAKLPKEIEVDVTSLNTFDDVIRVKDLVVPEGVTVENEAEETVALVVPVEEESEESATVDMSAIEVEKKGKEETEEKAE